MAKTLPSTIANQLVLPVMAAPMFLVSGPELVIESCKAGIISSFPTLNARPVETLESWLQNITSSLEKMKENEPTRRIGPWAANLIVNKTNKRFEEDLALLVKYKAPIVITSLGDPARVVEEVHAYGGLVFADVISITHAQKAAARGVDGLILVCNGAGGHAGALNPFAFVGAVRAFWDGILVVAGGISSGRDILAVRAMGADLAYMGTRFITARESMAHDDYKNMLIDSTLDDLIYTDAFTGVKGNYLIPSIQKAGLDPEKLQAKGAVDFSKLQSDAKAWRDIWSAGQGVSQIVQIQPVADLIQELREEYDGSFSSLASL